MLFMCEGNVQVSSDIDSLQNAVSPRSTETGAVMSGALQLHSFGCETEIPTVAFQMISRLQEL